jgi:hypothetical protein
MCVIKSRLRLDIAYAPLQAAIYNNLFAPVVEYQISPLQCLCLWAISADQLVLVSRPPAEQRSLCERLSLGVASFLTGTLLMWMFPSNMSM